MAAAVGVACWAQLCLAPPLAHRADPLVVVAALLALLALVVGTFDLLRRPALAPGVATVGFFACCALEALLLARHPVPRFDAPARLVAAATAVTYVAMLARARALSAPRVHGAAAPLAPAADVAPGPRLRPLALGALALVVACCALVGPAWIGAGASLEGGARGAERLLRGRNALTASGGLALGVLVALVTGTSLLRAEPPRARRAARALTYGVWAGVAWSMRTWLERAR